VPDKRSVLNNLKVSRQYLDKRLEESVKLMASDLSLQANQLKVVSGDRLNNLVVNLKHQGQLLEAYNPKLVLERGYSIVRKQGKVVRSVSSISLDDILDINLAKGELSAEVKSIKA
jgi:exodeoxyribonuclease VII large subunit